ncbi:MAG: methyl-accepting chemotaxis protein [Gammaproteobacteria bacterium]|nr:methyl-accepting chemotaxis protein [Gammaproteobacteria bacterium]
MKWNKLGLLWQMMIPVFAVFFIGIIVTVSLIPGQIERNVIETAIQSSEQTVQQFKTLRKYYADYVVQPVKGSGDISVAIDHKQNNKAIPLPATMIHDLSELSAGEGVTVKLYSDFPFPNRASRQLEAFESDAWSAITRNPDETYSKRDVIDGKQVLRVAIADKMASKVCVGCHNSHPQTPKNNWQLGDVRGILEVTTVIDDQLSSGALISKEVLLLLLGVLAISMLAIYFAYKMTIDRRLSEINRAMSSLAQGYSDLDSRMDSSGNDEISILAKNFNSFISKLQELIHGVANSSSSVEIAASEMSDLANQSNQKISQQKNETDQVTFAVEEMATAVQEVASNAATAESAASRAHDEAVNGQAVVAKTIASINLLAGEVEKASDVIKTLETESESIGSVLDVIKGIAEQTNLLALNAAIEAARAGEQGRGFAVVAEEVRTLASRTQESTLEIQDMIERIQASARSAVSVMNGGSSQAGESVQQVAMAEVSLKAIMNVINEIHEVNAGTASAAEQQSATAEQIKNSIVAIGDIAGQATMMAEKTAQGGGKLVDLTKELNTKFDHFKS